ncbi:MAG: serine/threonine protein kinase [Gammaproteobacteria bacterium]|nr:serine/threonine protein kinase [Gammaproteobacteria bacterium]
MNILSFDNAHLLHSGSHADIYKAYLNETIIIKSLKLEYINNDIILNRFAQEKNILKKLSSQYTPDLMPLKMESNTPYFTYKYIEGINLAEFIKKPAGLPVSPVNILKQLLNLIYSIHKMRVIHSDITPDNILLDNDLHIHLIDFGSADFVRYKNNETSTWIAKHAYCSPEQAQGLSWSFQSDLYQTGLLFYELLSGKKFNRGQAKQALAVASNPPPINYLDIDLKYHFILKKLLEPKLDKRCKNAHDALTLIDTI